MSLSCVRNLAGLVIQDCKEKVQYCWEDVKDETEIMPSFLVEQHGGVDMYTQHSLVGNVIQAPTFNLECLILDCMTYEILIVVIYQPPCYVSIQAKQQKNKAKKEDPSQNSFR